MATSNSKFCFNWNGTDYYIISPTYNSSAANQGKYAYKDANGTSIFDSVTPSGTVGYAENEVYLDNDTTTTYFQPYTSSSRAYYCHPRFLNPTYSTTSSTTAYRTVTATKTLTFSASSDCPMSSFTKTISRYSGVNLDFRASDTNAISLYLLNGTFAHSHSVPFTSFMTSNYNSLEACADANSALKSTIYSARKDFTVSRSFTLNGSNQTISSYTVYCTVFMDRFTPNVRSSSDYSPKSVT